MHQLIKEILQTVKSAAGQRKVIFLRLAVGSKISLPKVVLASHLHKELPWATIQIEKCRKQDCVIVREIEVE
ncbi:MAG: hypothetical protein QXT25_00245 [Candidatus Anstonellaceae archaeon]